MDEKTKNEIGEALGEHVQEQLEKRGWSKSAIRLLLLVGGALLAAGATWLLGGCGYSVSLERPGEGNIVIRPAVVDGGAK